MDGCDALLRVPHAFKHSEYWFINNQRVEEFGKNIV